MTLPTRTIGSLDVTVVGIGCNNFGRELDAEGTRDVVRTALDAGIAFFDTADSYGKPKTSSETLLGEALKGHRDEVIIATKFGRVLDETRQGAKRAYVRAATEASLKRLQTDRIDLMQLHIPDPDTPIEETLEALGELIAEGKIREIGCSNFSAADIRQASLAAEAAGLPKFMATQAEYSLLHREAAADILAECDRTGMKLLPFRPLYYGMLTGKYQPGSLASAGTRIGGKDPEAQARILSESNFAKIAALTRFAEERGHTLLELALAWLLAHEAVPSIIAGVTSGRQVASNVAAASWPLSPAEKAEVDQLLDPRGRALEGAAQER